MCSPNHWSFSLMLEGPHEDRTPWNAVALTLVNGHKPAKKCALCASTKVSISESRIAVLACLAHTSDLGRPKMERAVVSERIPVTCQTPERNSTGSTEVLPSSSKCLLIPQPSFDCNTANPLPKSLKMQNYEVPTLYLADPDLFDSQPDSTSEPDPATTLVEKMNEAIFHKLCESFTQPYLIGVRIEQAEINKDAYSTLNLSVTLDFDCSDSIASDLNIDHEEFVKLMN